MRCYRLAQPLLRRVALIALLGFLCSGCSSSSKRSREPMPPHYNAATVIDQAAPPGTYPPLEREIADSLAAALAKQSAQNQRPVETLPAVRSKPINVLVLSGGGQYASFAGGILVGWSALGTRPDFDIVTGVSGGGFTAVFAFLGPKYNSLMEKMTNLKNSDLYRVRPITNLIKNQSIATYRPFEKLVECEVNDDTIADIRHAHQMGRRLFVGTANARTRRLVIWDLGAIACSGRPDANALVRKIVVATSSIPGLAPAVKFDVEVNGVHYCEEHTDGGSLAQAFVRFGPETPRPDPSKPGAKWLEGSNLYTIAGGKLYADPVEGKMGVIKRVGSTFSGTLYALYRADLWRLFTTCETSGMQFYHTAIPPETDVGTSSTDFDPKIMHQLFALGYEMAQRNTLWRNTPPGYEPGEEIYPRAGLRFNVP